VGFGVLFGVGIDGGFLLVWTSLRSCVIDFRFSSLVLDYLIVVGQNDTQSFLHQNIPNFYCNVKSFVPDGQSLSNLRDKFLTNIYIGQPVQSS